jgi:hypothetical protein
MTDKLDQVEKKLGRGDTTTARDMNRLKTTRQFFLREMMQLRLTDGGIEPHINDEFFEPIPPNEVPDTERL